VQSLADLDLPHVPLEDPELARNPYPFFEAARAKHPWLAASNFGYVVHDYRAIRELYTLDDKLRAAFDGYLDLLEARATPWGRYMQDMIMVMPADQHRALRDAFAEKFTPRFANQLRPLMRENIGKLLDEWAPKGRFDFEEFASFFPISVMFDVIGAPPQEIASIKQSLETFGLALGLGKDQLGAIQEAYLHLESLVLRLIEARRADPHVGGHEDLLDLLISIDDAGTINHRQLVDLLIFLFVAGYDTSKNVLSFTLYTLMDYPQIYERCAVDLDYCEKVVEEALRYFSPAISPRLTNEDIVFRDVMLPKDTPLLFTLNISGRDPTAFQQPDRFDPERPIDRDRRQIAFGLGKHMCLGQFVARAQLQEGLHLIAQRIKDPRLDGQVGWRPFASTWGLKGLPIRFTLA
jgi:cytochrome P450